MVNLATRVERFTLAQLRRDVQTLSHRVEQVASSLNVVGKATIVRGRSLLIDGGSLRSIDGVIAAQYINRVAQLRASLLEIVVAFGDGSPTWTASFGIPGNSDGTVLATSGDLSLTPATGAVKIAHTTTSASANTVVDPTTGQLTRSTSSLRYKQDVEDLQVDPAVVLQLQGRTWRDRAEVEATPETTRRYAGAIAEELDELDGGLRQFVEYDEQGRPDAIAYDRLCVALITVCREHATRIEALEEVARGATS